MATLGILAANALLTARWAALSSSVNGSRRPLFMLAWLAVLVAALWRPRRARHLPPLIWNVLWLSSLTVLTAFFLVWFPPGVWDQIPITNNWAARYQTTIEGISLLNRGAAAGWQWDFLGGYPTSADFTVRVSLFAWAPVALFGDRVGFHVAHLAMFLAIPLAVYVDFRQEDPSRAEAAGAFATIGSAGFSYYLLQSGDTNSIAAVAATAVTLMASHLAAAGRRAGSILLPLGLSLVAYSHAGFFSYAVLLLMLEALYYKDRRRGLRTVVAATAAASAALPFMWEPLRHARYFVLNNMIYEPQPFDLVAFLRQVYYNVEILLLPGRWFNDYVGLTNASWPILAWTAWKVRGRAGFYALGALTAMVLLRLNAGHFGFALARQMHLMALFTPPALAGFAWSTERGPRMALLILALVASYTAVRTQPVAHVSDVADVAPRLLLDGTRTSTGAHVLIENNNGLDMIANDARRSERRGFGVNYEALLPSATGRRLYAGLWDGWQNVPYKGRLLASGAWMGGAIGDVPPDRFRRELRTWGIRDVFTWSHPSRAYFSAMPDMALVGSDLPWRHYRWTGADVRSVVTAPGKGVLAGWSLLGGTVELVGVRAGDPVIVRTSFHPAWRASLSGTGLPTYDADGQLGFLAPRDGSYAIELAWPRRPVLMLSALIGLFTGILITVSIPQGPGAHTGSV